MPEGDVEQPPPAQGIIQDPEVSRENLVVGNRYRIVSRTNGDIYEGTFLENVPCTIRSRSCFSKFNAKRRGPGVEKPLMVSTSSYAFFYLDDDPGVPGGRRRTRRRRVRKTRRRHK